MTGARWSLVALQDLPRAFLALLAVSGVQALVFSFVKNLPSLVFVGVFTVFWLCFAWLLNLPAA